PHPHRPPPHEQGGIHFQYSLHLPNTQAAMFDRLRPKRDQLDPEKHLEACAMCATDFVNPVDWEPVGDTHWWMLLRCGACDTWREVTVTNEIAARFDLELDRRLDVVARAL